MQTFLYNYFRIATLVAQLIDNEVSFDIFIENLLLSACFMACKCFSLPRFLNGDINMRRLFSEHKKDLTRKIISEISKLIP